MAVRGIEPSYFAGMPTTQRDPHAGQPGEGYMAAPGQALSDAASMNERRSERADTNAFRAREQTHREEQDRSSAARDDRRLAMYQQGEDRRQHQQGFENSRIKSADTMRLVQAMQAAINDGENGIAEALAAELKSRGWGVKPLGAQGAPAPGQPAQQVAPPGAAPAAPHPMSPADATTSAQLDQAERSIIPKLRGSAPAPAAPPGVPSASPKDAALSGQLDQIEQRYMNGLQAPGRPLVPGGPGSPLRAQVAQSNAMLDPNDPYNNIVK